MSRTTLAFAALIAVAAPAYAQERDPWTGFSIAVGGGAANIDISGTATAQMARTGPRCFVYPDDVPCDTRWLVSNGDTAFGDHGWRGFGTIQVGYDQRFDSIVLGALADLDFYPGNDAQGTSADFDVRSRRTNCQPNQVSCGSSAQNYAGGATSDTEFALDRVFNVGARIGYLANADSLLYVLGGYTQAWIKGQTTFASKPNVTPAAYGAASMPDLQGYFVGAGGEFGLARHLNFRVEYRFADYGAEQLTRTTIVGNTATTVTNKLDGQIQSVRAALVLKLGTP